MYSAEIDLLIRQLSTLQGIGPRSARRIALQLIDKKVSIMKPLGNLLIRVAESVSNCKSCGNYDSINPCTICSDSKRDKNIICVVEDVADLWALERSNFFKGIYHVLGGTLDALRGGRPDKLNLKSPGGYGFDPHIDGHFLWKDKTNNLRKGWKHYASNFLNVVVQLDITNEVNSC